MNYLQIAKLSARELTDGFEPSPVDPYQLFLLIKDIKSMMDSTRAK